MDDEHALSLARTEFREGFNQGNVDRVLSVFADRFSDMSDGQPSFFQEDSPVAMRRRLAELFRDYQVEMAPVIINFVVVGGVAIDFGWQKLWLTAKKNGEKKYVKQRYVAIWSRQPDGAWKITIWMTNRELPPAMEPLPEIASLGTTTLPS